jgi:L-fuculose-phosphate aldolase
MTRTERELIAWGKLLFERRLISGWGGNLSCRTSEEGFLITAQHAPLGFLTSQDVVRLDRGGRPASVAQPASSETPMHMAVYAGTDAQAIVHVHPPMVLAFSLQHDSFVPLSFEEKYTIGEVPIVAQDTPTVTKPERVVEALKYHPIIILKGHGTVAVGKNFQDAFLFTDLLEEAVHCQLFKARIDAPRPPADPEIRPNPPFTAAGNIHYELFSREHMDALVASANSDAEFRATSKETNLSTSLTLYLDETQTAWTVSFHDGEITDTRRADDGTFMICGEEQWWGAVFGGRIDPFFATQQGRLKLARGDLAELSRWYKPFQRAFSLWQTIPIR